MATKKPYDPMSDLNVVPKPTQSIELPQKPVQTNQKDVAPTLPQNQVLRDQFGNVNGIIRDGKIDFRSPQEVEILAQQEMLKKGGAATNQLEALNNQQNATNVMQSQIDANKALVGDVTKTPVTNTPQATNFSQENAAYQATAGAVPTLLRNVAGGAAAGAVVGGVPTLGIGAPLGAFIGGAGALVATVYSKALSSFEKQAGDVISQQGKVLSDGKTSLKNFIALVKADPVNADRYLADYQAQKSRIAEAHSKLKLDTTRDSFKFLGKDGSLVLQRYDDFYSPGGYAQILDANMQLALLGKNPDIADLMALEQSQNEENQ